MPQPFPVKVPVKVAVPQPYPVMHKVPVPVHIERKGTWFQDYSVISITDKRHISVFSVTDKSNVEIVHKVKTLILYSPLPAKLTL